MQDNEILKILFENSAAEEGREDFSQYAEYAKDFNLTVNEVKEIAKSKPINMSLEEYIRLTLSRQASPAADFSKTRAALLRLATKHFKDVRSQIETAEQARKKISPLYAPANSPEFLDMLQEIKPTSKGLVISVSPAQRTKYSDFLSEVCSYLSSKLLAESVPDRPSFIYFMIEDGARSRFLEGGLTRGNDEIFETLDSLWDDVSYYRQTR